MRASRSSSRTPPVNVLARADLSMSEIKDSGTQRVSVGGSLTWVAVAVMVDVARRMRDDGEFAPLVISDDLKELLG